MSLALVVDAACDLPKEFLDRRGIILFPISINVDGDIYTDDKEHGKMEQFYSDELLTLEHNAESIPYSPEQMAHLFKEEILPKFDYALVQTVSKKRSKIFDNCTAAQPEILQFYRENKMERGYQGHFGMRIMNSSTVFTGQAVLAAFTSDLILAGKTRNDIVRLSEAFKTKIYAYAVPPDVKYIRERARKRGEDSLSALSAFVAKSLDIKPIIRAKNDETKPVAKFRGFKASVEKLFEYARLRVELGLLCPYVVVSYAGNLEDLKDFDGYNKLVQIAEQQSVQLITCVMGLTTGLNIGPGAVSLALAAEEHEFDIK